MDGWAVLGILLLSLCLFGCASQPATGGESGTAGAGVSGEDLTVDELNVVSGNEGFEVPPEPVYSEELGISPSDLAIEDLELDTTEDSFVFPDEPI